MSVGAPAENVMDTMESKPEAREHAQPDGRALRDKVRSKPPRSIAIEIS